MANDPDAKGNYEVTPGESVTTVRVFTPSKPINEASLRESMIQIKDAMRRNFGREPNKLRFIFEEVTIDE